MQYFIGIVPPIEYKKRIIEFRNRWTNNGLREVVEPHITVKSQSGLTEDLVWLDKVREVCSNFSSFQLSISEPATFGTAVAFLSIESKEIFDLHMRLMEAISVPPELIRRSELKGFHPHLTLGQTLFGMTESEIEAMRDQAKIILDPFPVFSATYVRVYKEVETNKYIPFEDIQLANQ